MKPKKIKLFWALGLTATLLASATVALSILWPRLFPSLYVSDLYRRYENNEYIRATEIHNFRVNDTLAVETLLLEASTDSAWCALLLDFGRPQLQYDTFDLAKLPSGSVIETAAAPQIKTTPCLAVESESSPRSTDNSAER